MSLTVDRYYCWRIGGPVEGTWVFEGEIKCPECGDKDHTKLPPGVCGKFVSLTPDIGTFCGRPVGHPGPCAPSEEHG